MDGPEPGVSIRSVADLWRAESIRTIHPLCVTVMQFRLRDARDFYRMQGDHRYGARRWRIEPDCIWDVLDTAVQKMEAMDRLQDAINSMTSDLDRATIRRHALLSNLVLEAASDISLSSLETLRSDTAARGFRLIASDAIGITMQTLDIRREMDHLADDIASSSWGLIDEGVDMAELDDRRRGLRRRLRVVEYDFRDIYGAHPNPSSWVEELVQSNLAVSSIFFIFLGLSIWNSAN